MRIKLLCHSTTPGAVGMIGEVIEADDKVAQWLIDDHAAYEVKQFATFTAVADEPVEPTPVDPEPPKSSGGPLTSNPKPARR